MAENLLKIKSRMNGVRSISKITNAMKLISSAKFSRLKKNLEQTNAYLDSLEKILLLCLKSINEEYSENNNDNESYPVYLDYIYNENDSVNKTNTDLYIVINSTMGLCGSYNTQVIKYLESIIDKNNDQVLLIGTKGKSKLDENINLFDLNSLNQTNTESTLEKEDLDKKEINSLSIEEIKQLLSSSNFSYTDIIKLSNLLLKIYKTNKYRSIKLVYTHFKNALTFKPTCTQLLPLVIAQNQNEEKTDKQIENQTQENSYPPYYVPDKQTVLNLIIPKYLSSSIFKYIAYSNVSEEASRRMAMENASKNADELISNLTLTYNKARQSQITNQISDIVIVRFKDK